MRRPTRSDGNGCSGGLPENAYKTLIEIGGLETEEDYGEDKACKFNRSQVAAWRSDRTRPRWGTTGTPDTRGRSDTSRAATMRTGGHTFGYFIQLYPSYNFQLPHEELAEVEQGGAGVR